MSTKKKSARSDQGKAKKPNTKLSHIFQWIETHDADFAEAIRDLCMDEVLQNRSTGVTFLYPSDAVREGVVGNAYGMEAEDAIKQLKAHIFEAPIRTAPDFRKNVGSLLNVKPEVADIKDGNVILKNGAVLVQATDYQSLPKDNSFVWIVQSGEIPLEGPEYVAPKQGRAPAKKEKGPPHEKDILSRHRLAVAVENAYNTAQLKDRCRSRDPYLTHVVSLLNFLKEGHPGLFFAVAPLVDRDPMTSFYILVEPNKTRGDFLIPDEVLFGPAGWNGAQIFETPVAEFRALFEPPASRAETEDEGAPPWCFQDVKNVRTSVDNARLELLGADGRKANKVNLPPGVIRHYESLVGKNTVGGLSPVLPEATLRLLKDPKKKLWQDELRFMIPQAMAPVRTEPIYSEYSFAEVIRDLRTTRPGDDYAAEITLSNPQNLAANVAPKTEFTLLKRFVNSSDFLYTAVPEKSIGSLWGEVPTVQGSSLSNPAVMKDMSVLNTEVAKQALLDTYADAPAALDAGSIAAFQHYVKRHGKLPPGLEPSADDK